MTDKAKNVVLNFKMDGQVKYAETLKQINSVMNTAAKEYKNHIAAMGKDASATEKLSAEKKKLEIQMEGAQKRTKMLRDEYDAMAKDTKTTTEQLTKMYGKVLDAESAETKLQQSMERVTEGLSDQAIEARLAKDKLQDLKNESQLLEDEQKKLTSSFKLQNDQLGENASGSEKYELSQKQLRSQMELTKKAVDNLERQLEETKKVYGENSREVIQLETKMNDARSSVKKFERSMRDIEDSGKEAKKSLDGVGDGMQALAGAAPAAAIGGLVSGMKEYNEVLARLKTNAAISGKDLGVVEEAFEKITVVTGEADAAGETLANLLASGFTDEQLSTVIDQVNGAYIRFSDTLKTEGIADGIQETLAAGEAVGPFAELLERSGVKLDGFNSTLGTMIDMGEGSNFILKTLAEQGFGDVYNKYQELNPEVQANAEANAEMERTLADLALILTPLVTQVADFTTKVIEWANKNPELTATIAAGAAAIGGLITVLTIAAPIITAITLAAGAMGVSITAATLPILAIVGAIAAVIAIGVLLYKNWDTIKEKAGQLKDTVVNKVSELKTSFVNKVNELKDGAVTKFNNLRDKAGEVMTNAKEKILKPIREAKDKVGEIVDGIKGFFTNLKLKIPKPNLPPMPHFELEYSSKTLMGKKIEYPTGFDIDWRAKGAIFTEPTIFGMNNGRLQGAGDAGPEAALPLNAETLGAIGKGIAATMTGTNGNVEVHVYLDTDEMNTKLAPGMSRKLNQQKTMKTTGRVVIS